jgi:hypothetical protein
MLQDPQLLQVAELLNCLDDVRAWVKDRGGCFCWVSRTALLLFSLDDPGILRQH